MCLSVNVFECDLLYIFINRMYQQLGGCLVVVTPTRVNRDWAPFFQAVHKTEEVVFYNLFLSYQPF